MAQRCFYNAFMPCVDNAYAHAAVDMNNLLDEHKTVFEYMNMTNSGRENWENYDKAFDRLFQHYRSECGHH